MGWMRASTICHELSSVDTRKANGRIGLASNLAVSARRLHPRGDSKAFGWTIRRFDGLSFAPEAVRTRHPNSGMGIDASADRRSHRETPARRRPLRAHVG